MAQANPNPGPAQNPAPQPATPKKKIPWRKIVTAAALGTTLLVGGLYLGSRGNKGPTYNQINHTAAEQVEIYGGNNYGPQDKRRMTTEVTQQVQDTVMRYEKQQASGHHKGHHSRADKPGDASGL
jgi:hypothetical protein